MKKFGILFWIDAITYDGKVFQDHLIHEIEDDNDSISNNDEADKYLEDNMRSIMETYNFHTVIGFAVAKIGFDLQIPVPELKVETPEKKASKPRVKKEVVIIDEPIVATPIPPQITLDYIKLALAGRPTIENVYAGHLPLEIPNRDEITQKLKNIIGNKKILFIENSSFLDNSIGNFYHWTIEEGIDSFCLFSIKNIPLDFIKAKIIEYDVIAFQSQFVYQNSLLLKDFVTELQIEKTIIGCSISHVISYNPSKIHTFYNLDCMDGDFWDWKLTKFK